MQRADIEEAFAPSPIPRAAATVPAQARGLFRRPTWLRDGAAMGQDRIGTQIAAMTPAQRQRLIAEFPSRSATPTACPGTCEQPRTVSTLPRRSLTASTIRHRAAVTPATAPAQRDRRPRPQRSTVDRQILWPSIPRVRRWRSSTATVGREERGCAGPGARTRRSRARQPPPADRSAGSLRPRVATSRPSRISAAVPGAPQRRVTGARRRRRSPVCTGHGARGSSCVQRRRRPHRRRATGRLHPASPTSAIRTADRSLAPPKRSA